MRAEQPPYGSENRTFICTVVFVDLVGYSQQAVAQQMALKRHLNELIGRALEQVAESDRLALDTGDGAALCFFGDPEDALFAAANLRDAVKADPGPVGAQVRIGINLGPARLVKDLNGNRNIIGDGINVAQRVMSFAVPNQILVSRSYYEVVSHISTEYAQLFQYAGLHRDKHVREHEVYEVHGGRGSVSTTDERPPGVRELPSFSPEVLARVTRTLAGHLGPVAKLIVQRASIRARDVRELLAAAAESLTGATRDAFMAQVADLTVMRPPAPPPPGPVVAPIAATSASGAPVVPGAHTASAGPDRRRRTPVTPELLAAAEERLARHVGPIARLLVTQAAKDVADAGELVDRLALRIDDPAARESFLAAMQGRR
jgi:class 3 adenylate cyclase